MSHVKISIVASSIRPWLWKDLADHLLFNSINYEVVMVGPAPGRLPAKFRHIHTSVKPAQCYEIGFRNAVGELVAWTADDACYSPNALDVAYNFWKSHNNEKFAVAFRAIEDGTDMTDKHRLIHGDMQTPIMAPFGLMSRKFLMELGGYDRRFICGQSENDVIMRVYEAGGTVEVCPEVHVYARHSSSHDNSKPRAFSVYYSHDRSVLEELWIQDGRVTQNRLGPVERFSDDRLLTETQGPRGCW